MVFGERQAPSLTPISESEMSPTSPTILDDLDIPKRTAHLAVMGKGGASIYSHLADTKRLLRAEMTRRGVSYEDLAEKLAAIGVQDTAVNPRNKVARGRFSATFLVQCLTAMGARAIRLSENANGQ